jgi:hypothetical protein
VFVTTFTTDSQIVPLCSAQKHNQIRNTGINPITFDDRKSKYSIHTLHLLLNLSARGFLQNGSPVESLPSANCQNYIFYSVNIVTSLVACPALAARSVAKGTQFFLQMQSV